MSDAAQGRDDFTDDTVDDEIAESVDTYEEYAGADNYGWEPVGDAIRIDIR